MASHLLREFHLWSFIIGVVASALILWLIFTRRARAQSMSINIPFGLGSATFDLTPKDRVAAWKLHVQLVTRKAALPFDREHDVIADVLSSLFDLFQVARELLLEMPPSDSSDQRGVAGLMVRVLNDGIRPTLTHWQADYRRWWEARLAEHENVSRSPQQIQREYPQYSQLVDELTRMNMELSKFSDELALAASGASRQRQAKSRIVPTAPEQIGSKATVSVTNGDDNPPPSNTAA
jgi:hypothetical protein